MKSKSVNYITDEVIELILVAINTNIDALPKTDIPKNVCGVYFLYLSDNVVYVGKSKNINQRIHEHLKSKKFDYYRVFECDESLIGLYERIFINKLKPILNCDSLTNKIKKL